MGWAPWLTPLPDAELMRSTDRWAIEERGVPSLELMERAGEGLARVVEERVPAGRIAVVCGKGNNGGDGLVVARLLREAGREVRVLIAGDPDELRGDARANLERLPGDPATRFEGPAQLDGAAGIVDALLGTGFEGEPRDPVRGAIAAIDAAGATVVAADVPSGVNAGTGAIAGEAVRATATATFHQGKPGLWIAPGKQHAGEVRVVDIAMPAGGPGPAASGLIDPAVLAEIPRRGADATKFSSGAVVVLGGSAGLTGAPTMAALGAQRAGAGYVTVATARSAQLGFQVKLLEAMTRGLPDEDGALTEASVEPALTALERAGAAVLGPGLGRADHTVQFARAVARRAPVPLVLDADGLNAHAGRLEDLAARTAPTVLTPHAGELGRLLGVDSAAIGERRIEHAQDAARRAGAIVVLKGDDTIVALPDGRTAIARGGAPGLATAGTGDVLSGVIGALLAKGMAPATAVCAGVHAHQCAGRLAAEPHGPDTVIASDVIAALPAALAAGRGR
ncbi:MAG TPA: NAD(P)H-hydrate dehydratase [Solirubrobacteraceae bacterium]